MRDGNDKDAQRVYSPCLGPTLKIRLKPRPLRAMIFQRNWTKPEVGVNLNRLIDTMILNKLILILLTIYLVACEKASDKLFLVTENTGQRSDLLFLAESTNVPTLKNDSLKRYFRPDELEFFIQNSITFKNYGKIHETHEFKAYVLLMKMETIGRFYAFVIQTYDNDFKQIDQFELAAWDEREKQFCYGSINKDLIIERKCNYKKDREIFQITDNGKIVMTSFHKP
jgi:hypothetical protein